IEAALASHPSVSRALVSTRDGDLVAWIAGDADPDELRAHLRRTLPDYMLPAHFVSIDEVPLTSNNKIDWKSLPAPGAAPREDAVAPRDAIEHAVAAIWQRVLGLDSLSIHDNYFHLGGDSIKVIRITGAIASELGVRVEVKDLFRWPTVAELAEHIRSGSLRADPALDAAYETLDAMRDALLPRQDLNNDWEDVFPLSDIEQGMLFHASLDAAVYHDQFVFELRDDAYDDAYDHRAFTRAFELLVAKHPMLRTSFHLEGFDEPVQVVHRDLEVEIPFEDARFVADQETRLEALMRADRETPFDVTRPGLWRARVLRFAANRYAFVWAVHHAIVDGWSNASLFAELNETYARVKRGDDTPLPPLRATYRDFIADQLRWRASEPAREFWSRELDGWEHMRLPFGKDASSGPRGARRRTVHRVDPDVGQALATLARQEGLSPRDAWLAAFACLMELTTGRRELLFGIVTNNRPAIADGDAIFGCFLNSMPLRVALPFPRTPREILRTLADTLRRIKPHEMLPMRRIAEIAGATASSPFFDVLFNYIDFHVLERVATPRALYLYESTNTPLDVSISATLGDFSVATYWLDGIFTEDEIERLATYYARLLERFAATPDAPLTSDDILGAPDAIENWEPLPQTIDELFNEVALTFPDRPAVGAMTYAELDARSDALAAQLELEPEECVAVMGERSEETVVAFLAVIKAGGAYVPIDPDWPQPRIDYVLNDTRCRYFIRGGALA
ncbi:MAG TPA: condensation domain-containing protein, partial [Thermoanaerobaculia bacterium]|nr:condensation domain-containing protein [Thermoanaerobaculia bacterium]